MSPTRRTRPSVSLSPIATGQVLSRRWGSVWTGGCWRQARPTLRTPQACGMSLIRSVPPGSPPSGRRAVIGDGRRSPRSTRWVSAPVGDCWVGSVTSVIYSKRLSEAGLSPQSVLAVRFFLILAVTWTLTGLSAKPQLAATFLPALFIAVTGVAIPLYLLQVGIQHTEPITAAIVPSLSPLVAYLLQLPVGRLKASALTLAGVLEIVILVARHDARN